MQFLPCSLSTVLFLSPQPAFCQHKEQKNPPETRRHGGAEKLGQWLWVRPADVDMAIREAHPAMALLPSGQSQQISRYCQHCHFIYPPHICLNSHTTGEEIKAALDLPLCTEISLLQLSNNSWEKTQGEIRHHYQHHRVKPNCSLSVLYECILLMCMRRLPQWGEN